MGLIRSSAVEAEVAVAHYMASTCCHSAAGPMGKHSLQALAHTGSRGLTRRDHRDCFAATMCRAKIGAAAAEVVGTKRQAEHRSNSLRSTAGHKYSAPGREIRKRN